MLTCSSQAKRPEIFYKEGFQSEHLECHLYLEELCYQVNDLPGSLITGKGFYPLPSRMRPATYMYYLWMLLGIIEDTVGDIAVCGEETTSFFRFLIWSSLVLMTSSFI